MSREALVLLVCCCDFRDGAERLIPSKSLRNAVIRAFPGLLCILRMCAPRRAAAVVRPRGREKSADRRRRILISRLLIIRASVPRRKSPFPAYFKGFPAVSPLIPPYPAFLKYPVSPQKRCKFLTLMLALLLLLQSSALAADKGKTVTVTLPTFAVTLNDTKIDSAHSEYPLIVYRDITYFPMTYHASRFLHLKSNWYQTEPKGTLFVGYSDASEDTWTDTPATSKNTVTAKATVADYQIAVNTVDKGKCLDNSAEPYPLLNFRGVTYFPLTWRFAVEEFGWEYHFDAKSGLSIRSAEQFRPELEDALLASSAPSAALVQKTYFYGADKSEYAGVPYSNLAGATFVYRRSGEAAVTIKAQELFSDGEYYFDCQDSENAPVLSGGVLTLSARRTDSAGQATVTLKIDLRSGTLLP